VPGPGVLLAVQPQQPATTLELNPRRNRVILLVQDLQIRIVNAATGELLRELILDPTRDYQPTGAPKGPTRRPPK
jgi:hypothetical protein